jgi:hypothetical protein
MGCKYREIPSPYPPNLPSLHTVRGGEADVTMKIEKVKGEICKRIN